MATQKPQWLEGVAEVEVPGLDLGSEEVVQDTSKIGLALSALADALEGAEEDGVESEGGDS